MKICLTKYLGLFLFMTLNLTTVFGQDVFEKIKSKTWFESDEFAGVTVVFFKDNKGELKAFRQINGSGVSVIATNIFRAEIRFDSIILINTNTSVGQNLTTSERIIYTFNDKKGLTRGGRNLSVTLNAPIIQLFTDNNQIIGEPINVFTITKYDFDNKVVYVNDKLYKINPKDK